MSDKVYTKPELRERLKNKILAGSRGGKPGQWSARKAQLLAKEYEAEGGGYKGKKQDSQKDLERWTKEEWTTSDGKPAKQADGTMRRYLPKKAWKDLSPAERAETNKKKVEGSKKGEQFISNTSEAKQARKKVSQKLSKSIDDPVLYLANCELSEFQGQVIKHLYLTPDSATIEVVPFVSEKQRRWMWANDPEMAEEWEKHNKSEGCAHSAEKTCERCSGGDSVSKSTVELLKGLTSRMISTLKNIKSSDAKAAELPVESGETIVEVSVLTGPMVAQAMHVNRPFEQPIAPTVRVATPFQAASPTSPDFMASCNSCGYTHKSLNDCPRCASLRSQNREASPVWRR
jgi:hypothetical protein